MRGSRQSGLYAVSMATDMQSRHGYVTEMMCRPSPYDTRCISHHVFVQTGLMLIRDEYVCQKGGTNVESCSAETTRCFLFTLYAKCAACCLLILHQHCESVRHTVCAMVHFLDQLFIDLSDCKRDDNTVRSYNHTKKKIPRL